MRVIILPVLETLSFKRWCFFFYFIKLKYSPIQTPKMKRTSLRGCGGFVMCLLGRLTYISPNPPSSIFPGKISHQSDYCQGCAGLEWSSSHFVAYPHYCWSPGLPPWCEAVPRCAAGPLAQFLLSLSFSWAGVCVRLHGEVQGKKQQELAWASACASDFQPALDPAPDNLFFSYITQIEGNERTQKA